MIESYKTNLRVSEAGAPIQIGGDEFFSQPFKDRMYEGSQNTDSGSKILNVQHEDYSSASFYRVEVTGGEQAIYVKGTNNPTTDGNDKIIY